MVEEVRVFFKEEFGTNYSIFEYCGQTYSLIFNVENIKLNQILESYDLRVVENRLSGDSTYILSKVTRVKKLESGKIVDYEQEFNDIPLSVNLLLWLMCELLVMVVRIN